MPDPFGPPGCPYDSGDAGIGRPIDVRTVTLHRTIGRWPGDYSVGKHRDHNSGTFQWLIGQDDGQWVQFYPANSFCSHAAGSNEAGPGIEISGQNGEDLTDWQVDALGRILRWLRDEWHVAPTFTDGDPRVWIDTVGPAGFVTHRHVAYPPRPSLHHYDYITDDEFTRALAPAPVPDPPKKDDTMRLFRTDGTDTWTLWDGFNWTENVDHSLVWALAVAGVPSGVVSGQALYELHKIVGEHVEALVQRIAVEVAGV